MLSRRFIRYLASFTINISVLLCVITILTKIDIIYNDNQRNINEDKKTRFLELKSTSQSNFIHVFKDIERIIKKTRSKVQYGLSNYNFSYSGVETLEDLLLESGGKPILSLILSSYSTGSSFFGEILSSIPGTYYHFEPLRYHGTIEIRPPETGQSVNVLKNMLKCNFHETKDYFEYIRNDRQLYSRNNTLWQYCKQKSELCFEPEFVSELCRLFPFQVMKLCRLRLRFIKELLDDENLNVKIIILIRDPRGLFNSRWRRNFCLETTDCKLPEIYCANIIRDYITTSQLLPLYPDRLMILRFEDLAINLEVTTHRVLKFLGLSTTVPVDEYLKSHTMIDGSGLTNRVSRNVPFKWKYSMDFQDVDEIQMICKEAMSIWGYRMAYNATHMSSKEFNPIIENWQFIV